MNLKGLFVVLFLCLLNASIICNAATVVLNTVEGWSCPIDREIESIDPRPGGPWPKIEENTTLIAIL